MNAHDYYRLRYPYDELVALLTSNGDELHHFEFAIEGTDTYTRYVSVHSAKELKAAVTRHRNVATFHFGPAFTGLPESRKSSDVYTHTSVPHRRVLSFDVDLTDYDWLGFKDKEVPIARCDWAYPVSAIALQLLKKLLEEAFAYTKILMVYSGRRGVHVHVFDEHAMALSDAGRSAVAGYLNNKLSFNKNVRSDDEVRLLMFMHNLKPTVYELFENVLLKRMDLFGSLDARVNFVNRLEVEQYPKLAGGALLSLADDVMDMDTGEQAWEFIRQKVLAVGAAWMAQRLDAVVLAYVWPRLDYHVTADLGHLTKVPFAAHAKTRRVAVAIDPDDFYAFDPTSAPQLDTFDDAAMAAAVQRFRLKPPVTRRPPTPDDLGAVCDLEDLARGTDPVPMDTSKPENNNKSNKRPLPRKMRFERKPSPLAVQRS